MWRSRFGRDRAGAPAGSAAATGGEEHRAAVRARSPPAPARQSAGSVGHEHLGRDRVAHQVEQLVAACRSSGRATSRRRAARARAAASRPPPAPPSSAIASATLTISARESGVARPRPRGSGRAQIGGFAHRLTLVQRTPIVRRTMSYTVRKRGPHRGPGQALRRHRGAERAGPRRRAGHRARPARARSSPLSASVSP